MTDFFHMRNPVIRTRGRKVVLPRFLYTGVPFQVFKLHPLIKRVSTKNFTLLSGKFEQKKQEVHENVCFTGVEEEGVSGLVPNPGGGGGVVTRKMYTPSRTAP